MKNKFKRIISALLAAAILLSCFAVFASAREDAELTSSASDDILTVLYNRNYSDGWDASNGLDINSNKNGNDPPYIGQEIGLNGKANFFLEFDVINSKALFAIMDFNDVNVVESGNPANFFMHFSVKSDDYANHGDIINFTTYGPAKQQVTHRLVSIKSNQLYLFSKDTGVALSDMWTDVSIKLEYTGNNGKIITAYGYVGEDLRNPVVTQTFELKENYGAIKQLNLGFINNGVVSERVNANICFDNITVYTGGKSFSDIPDNVHGSCVDSSWTPDQPNVDTNAGDGKTTEEHLDAAYVMKIGVEYALANNEKVAIYDGNYGAPFKNEDGVVMVPIFPLLIHANTPFYMHEDGYSLDISTSKGAVYLKANMKTASLNGELINLTAAPTFVQAPDGKHAFLAVAMNDVETFIDGWYITYDDMGLIIFAQRDDIINRDDNLQTMLDLMIGFIFDYPEAEVIRQDAIEHTGGLEHPYIYGDIEEFDYLANVYLYGEDITSEYYNPELYEYLQKTVDLGYSRFLKYARYSYDFENNKYIYNSLYVDDPSTPDVNEANYDLLPVNPYTTYDPTTLEFISYVCNKEDCFRNPTGEKPVAHYGYDCEGQRATILQNYAQYMAEVGFAYIITRDIELAKFAYDYMTAFGQLTHWGPAHMLDAAGCAGDYAQAFDWMYIGFEQLEEEGFLDFRGNPASVDKIASHLYDKGLRVAYRAVVELLPVDEHGMRDSHDYTNYSTAGNNWAMVCTSGMGLAAMALLSYDEPVEGREDGKSYQDLAVELLSRTLYTVTTSGGSFKYAPDGSYDEAPNYWAYGTTNFGIFIEALASVFGTEYGMLNMWGLDTTWYFACQVESSDYAAFNFNDGGAIVMDTSNFFGIGTLLGDRTLVEIRRLHIANGKEVTRFDCLNYVAPDDSIEIEMPLDYLGDGIDVYTTRSSWDKGAIFAGMIGGDSEVGHGHLDNGTFVYHANGIIWIMDMGMENYNVYGAYGKYTRYYYYRLASEGHNTVVLASEQATLPLGMSLGGHAESLEMVSNEFGSYATFDMTNTYGSHATYATRGLMLTGDRSVVVVQDEMAFKKLETCYWFAHTRQTVVLSEDKRTAYLTTVFNDGTSHVVRASIVSRSSQYEFEVWDTHTYVLDCTFPVDSHLTWGGGAQNSRDASYKKLAVKADNIIMFNFSVVFEVVDEVDSTMPVGYEWTEIAEWEPYTLKDQEDTPVVDPGEDEVVREKKKYNNKTIFVKEANKLTNYLNKGNQTGVLFNGEFAQVYKSLCDVEFTKNIVGEKNITGAYLEQYQKCVNAREIYDDFVVNMNALMTVQGAAYKKLAGINIPEKVAEPTE